MITSYTRADQLISQERNGVKSYYLYDGFDSVRMLANDECEITDTYTYDAFGNLISSTGNTVNDFLYRGERFDSFTGLYYLRARYMNPSTGTFITMDEYAGSIFEPVSLHKYLYANANPVTYSDPSGYFSLSELNVTQAIEAQLHKMLVPNFKNIMNMINGMASWCDFCHQVGKMLSSGATLEDIIESIARGVISGALLNLMCQMEMLGPLLKAFLVGYGYYIQIDAFNKAVEEGDIISAVLIAIQLGTDLTALADSCFTGETFVATEDGKKRIDEIEVGDKVWAYNVETGETELKEVTTVYVHEVQEILHLETTEGDIDTTTNHPFYVIDKGWVAAGDLKSGDEVYNLDGSTAVIIDSELEKLDEPILVYNLEVEDFHTYFVGYEPVLVHNSCASSRENWGPEHGKNNTKHNNAIEDELDWANTNGATDIRKNQPQVDADGERVFSDTGNYNKPDASYNLGGNRYNTNYVSNPNNIREVNREINAFNSIVQNDPNAFSSLVFKY